MTATIIIILVLIVMVTISCLAISWLWKSRKTDKENIALLSSRLAARERLINVLQEADNVANKQKNKMSAGSISDRVNASVDILRDISAGSTSKD